MCFNNDTTDSLIFLSDGSTFISPDVNVQNNSFINEVVRMKDSSIMNADVTYLRNNVGSNMFDLSDNCQVTSVNVTIEDHVLPLNMISSDNSQSDASTMTVMNNNITGIVNFSTRWWFWIQQ